MTVLLWDQMRRIRAEEEMRQAHLATGMTARRWSDLVMEATGDEEEADKAHAQFLLAQVQAGVLKE